MMWQNCRVNTFVLQITYLKYCVYIIFSELIYILPSLYLYKYAYIIGICLLQICYTILNTEHKNYLIFSNSNRVWIHLLTQTPVRHKTVTDFFMTFLTVRLVHCYELNEIYALKIDIWKAVQLYNCNFLYIYIYPNLLLDISSFKVTGISFSCEFCNNWIK